MPLFAPLRVRGGAQRLRRAMHRRRRAMAAGLAVTAAALAASSAQGSTGPAGPLGPSGERGPGTGALTAAAPAAQHGRPATDLVSAPVRIADAATVRLLRPGDRVDVIASADSPAGEASRAEVVASGARVADVPQAHENSADGGALVVLSVPRTTAVKLAGAGANSRLAVTVC
ncbi:RcpC/CpaB family pilus assembly protein [Streptomyces sp. NPDC002187]|uniref:RcpC/CpaB family pilus assembly protein n=1 Tax=Streptomyces sp. NPDC002187 TaxID=3364637 RepID=UPI0036A62A39